MGEIDEESGVTGEIDGRPVAIYRSDGMLTVMENLCTHLQCGVSWNEDDRAWECPCHGSKFSPTGEVLRGPAKKRLHRLDYVLSGDFIELEQDGTS